MLNMPNINNLYNKENVKCQLRYKYQTSFPTEYTALLNSCIMEEDKNTLELYF